MNHHGGQSLPSESKQWHVRFANFCYKHLATNDLEMSAQGLIQAFVDEKGTMFVPNITSAAWILRRDGRFKWTDEKCAIYFVA